MTKSFPSLNTARLLGEPLSLGHFSEIHRLHTDPPVMKTLSADGKPATEEATQKHLQRCSDHWDQHGFGLWVFRARANGQFIGRGGLMTYQIDGEHVVGLAYAVMSDHWNLRSAGRAGNIFRISSPPRESGWMPWRET